ncbi:HAMP domain-containing protein, partial [Pseudomonas viridiflava]|uniref:HAMP domain-containing protein n=1 Tax=Pseudomonas viridiflava TaxID=33069 RepID=UPI001F11BAC1
LVGFDLALALAVFLGWVLARRVMAPVVRLARQVRHRDRLLGLAPPLAPDYAADEVGELAVAFDATLGRLRQALIRERMFTRSRINACRRRPSVASKATASS